ncbi:unnamed protein product [Camellia sinensis]
MKEASLKLEGIFGVIIDQREKMDGLGRSKGDESKDFLQVLLKLKDNGDAKTPLTMTHVKALLAGPQFLHLNVEVNLYLLHPFLRSGCISR